VLWDPAGHMCTTKNKYGVIIIIKPFVEITLLKELIDTLIPVT
jgi:hypothetical protein